MGGRPSGGTAEDLSRDSHERLKVALADRYLVERELGRGGMAVVYLAQDLRHNRHVAVKVLLPEIATLLGPDRFLREIEITAQLQHPNIVPVHDSGNADGILYYVMPYITGESLRARLARAGKLPTDEVLRITREVADALGYAHEQGVVHRDIKPENILLSAGHAQVADFGIARAVSAAGGEELTRTGMIVGTPAYMSPEQAAGLPDVDGRADLYALAAVAHEALVGDRGDPMAAARTSEAALTAARPDVPPSLARALSTPLALERELRPGTAAEWLRMLDTDGRGPRSTKRLAAGVGILAVLAVLIGWWVRGLGHGSVAVSAIRQVAVLPVTVTGAPEGSPVGTWIRDAIVQLVPLVPNAEVVQDSTRASELLHASAQLTADSQIQLRIQVVQANSRDVRSQADGNCPIDSLLVLVKAVFRDAYADRVAAEQIGWDAALPSKTENWIDFTQGRQAFFAGNYAEADRAFERVIDREPTYAFAHFWRVLTEILRSRPTQAMTAVETALDAARQYRDSLDPTTRELLAGYETLIAEGDLLGAIATFERIVDRNQNALAYFVLGYLKVNFPGLLRKPPIQAEYYFQRAYELEPHFAAAIVQLARISLLRNNPTEVRRYAAEYFALDSTSATAKVLQIIDSSTYGSARVRLMGSFREREPTVLEFLALGAGAIDLAGDDREGSRVAIEELWSRAATREDLTTAFRLYMASLLGSAEYRSAEELIREGVRRGVPRDEVDAWLLLPAVTLDLRLGGEDELTAAARRLAERGSDPTALWLAARWLGDHDPPRGREVVASLRSSVSRTAPDTVPLTRGLLLDLQARDALAGGDTSAALAAWEDATTRYSIGAVPFGLVASMWPVQLARAQIAAAAGQLEVALAAADHFRYMGGFVDQIAWPVIWPLAIQLQREADPLTARELAELLRPVINNANGSGVAIYDSLFIWAGSATTAPPR